MGKQVRVGCFNLENLDDSNPAKFASRKKLLQSMLLRMRADILILQEVNSLSALTQLIHGTPYQAYDMRHTMNVANTGEIGHQDQVILSKYPIKNRTQYRNTLVGELKWQKVTEIPAPAGPEDIDFDRPILKCTVELGQNKDMHLFSVHLKSKLPFSIKGQKDANKSYMWLSHEAWAEGYFISSMKRVGQALETRMALNEVWQNEPDALIVVAGDFNAETGSVPFLTLAGSIEETSNPDLNNKVMVACEMNVPEDRRYSLLHRGQPYMIDHVLVSREMYPYWVETEIFNEMLPDESIAYASDIKYPESDHAPVIATFELPDSFFT